MAQPKPTIKGLQQELKVALTQLDHAGRMLDMVSANSAANDTTGLMDSDGKPIYHDNPHVTVAIFVDGRGMKTTSVFKAEAIKEAGWPALLAQACMEPMALMARKLECPYTEPGSPIRHAGN